MFMLGLNEAINQLIMANSVCWYSHELRRQNGHVLRKALKFEVEGQILKGRLKSLLKKLVEEEYVKVCLSRGDVLCLSKWTVDVNQITTRLRRIRPPSLVGGATRF